MAEGTTTIGTPVDIEALHANSEIIEVPLDSLKIDRSYQRDPSQTLIDKIAEDWDEVSSELLLVSDRGPRDDPQESGLFIVNGQHRTLGARKRGLEKVWARKIDLRNHPDPAAVEATFRLRTNVRMGDKPLERFKAQLRAGDPESVAIVKILEKFDTEVNEQPDINTGINAVAAVEKLYRADEGRLLQENLQLLKDIYGQIGGRSTTAPMLYGFAWFINKHADESDRSRVVERTRDLGIAALDRRARTLAGSMPGTLWQNYYRAIVDTYNERLQEKSKLEWRTRGANVWKGSGSGGSRWD